MSTSGTDYKRLYNLQDQFLNWFTTLKLPFYLTGETALGRFYLAHRYSNDLDFFVNDDPGFLRYIDQISQNLGKRFKVDMQHSLFAEEFFRVFIEENGLYLKIEFVNDVKYHPGGPLEFKYGWIDTPENILANKLSAIAARDEPKDVFDIIYLAINYSFNWETLFYHTKKKTIINELDVERRLSEFPVKWFEKVRWVKEYPDMNWLRKRLYTIADDFLLGRDNSLGKKKQPLHEAQPLK